MVRVCVGVRDIARVWVSVNKVLGSDYCQGKFRVRVRIMVNVGLGLWLPFDPNTVLTPTLTLTFNLTHQTR